MTTVVSRLYKSADAAERVKAQLTDEGFPADCFDIITEADAKAMKSARVSDRAAQSYAAAMKSGQALFVCRAPFTPFGAARVAMDTADTEVWVDTGIGARNEYIREVADLPKYSASVLTGHQHMLLNEDYVGSGIADWTLSWVFGFPLISRKSRRNKVISGGRYMSRSFWPGKLLSTKPRKSSVFSGGRYMFGAPRVAYRNRPLKVLHGAPLITARFGMRMLSKNH